MSLKDWWTKNLYVTSPKDRDAFFHPRRYALPQARVARAAHEIVAQLKGWTVQEYRETQGRIQVLRRGFFPFQTEDVNLYIVQGLDGVTKLEATSQSRVGRGDWGRNRRNLREFLTRMDAMLPSLG